MVVEYSSCLVSCHRCNHEWVYMGTRLASLARTRRLVKVHCPRCQNNVKLDVRNAK